MARNKLTPREEKIAHEIMEIYQEVVDQGDFDRDDASPAILAAEIYRRAREEEDQDVARSLTIHAAMLAPGMLITEGDYRGKMVKAIEATPDGRTFHPSVYVTFLDGELLTITNSTRVTVQSRDGIPIIHSLPGNER